MNGNTSDRYIFSAPAFLLLLASYGDNGVYIPSVLTEGISQEDYIYAMQDMASAGILINEGEKFRINEPYKSIMRDIYCSGTVLSLHSAEKALPDKFIYISGSGKLTVCEMSTVKPGSIRIKCDTAAGFCEDLSDEGYIDREMTGSPETELNEIEEKYLTVDGIFPEDGESDMNVLLSVRELAGADLIKKSFAVVRLPQGLYIIAYGNEAESAVPYCREALIAAVENMTTGGIV